MAFPFYVYNIAYLASGHKSQTHVYCERDVRYDERLIHEIWSAGYEIKEKTPKNMTNFGSVYVFYLGYLMGAGKLREE